MRFIFKEETESTNADALALPADSDHVAVCAAVQTGGRGRHKRLWVSPRGNLYVSFCVKIDNLATAGRYSFMTAVALAETLESFGLNPKCKWPNDVLLDGKKVSGILLETDGARRLVAGIGVNLVSSPAAKVLYPTAALSDYGIRTTPRETAEILAEKFESWENRPFSAVLEAWKSRAFGLGGVITANLPERKLTGTFYGLDCDGALLLKCGKEIIRITAADVFFGKQESERNGGIG